MYINPHGQESFSIFSGGNLGLFTGISILSMCEIIFWVLKLLRRIFSGTVDVDVEPGKTHKTNLLNKNYPKFIFDKIMQRVHLF